MKDGKKLLSTREVAELIGQHIGSPTHPLTIGRLIRARELRAVNISHGKVRPRYRIYKHDVLEYIQQLKRNV